MKFENNWKNKTLENLEKNVWPPLDPNEGSHLIKTCNLLRKKQLNDFTFEDLREMIGQDIGLKFLIPIALEILEENILAEGNFYEGDLLKSVLTSDVNYWKENKENWNRVIRIFEKNKQLLEQSETIWGIKKGWFDAFKNLKNIN